MIIKFLKLRNFIFTLQNLIFHSSDTNFLCQTTLFFICSSCALAFVKDPSFTYNEYKLGQLNNDLVSCTLTMSSFNPYSVRILLQEQLKKPYNIEDGDMGLDVFSPNFDSLFAKKVRDAYQSSDFFAFYLEDRRHQIVIAFQNDGQFVLVDSLPSYSVITSERIGTILNAQNPKIKNHNDKDILFRGAYINTKIQGASNFCAKFSLAYAFHMLKTKRLDAWQDLNSALSDGSVKSLGDLINLSLEPRAPKTIDLKVAGKNGDSLIKSMSYYSALGIDASSWKDIPTDYLSEEIKIDKTGGSWLLCGLNKDKLLLCRTGFFSDDPDPTEDYKRRPFLYNGVGKRIDHLEDLAEYKLTINKNNAKTLGDFYSNYPKNSFLLKDFSNGKSDFYNIGNKAMYWHEIIDGTVYPAKKPVYPF